MSRWSRPTSAPSSPAPSASTPASPPKSPPASPDPPLRGRQVIDPSEQRCNHNYMSTKQAEPTPADDTDASDDTSQSAPASQADEVRAWFIGRLPGDWFTEVPAILLDREEITVIGALAAPDPAGTSDAERAAAAEGRIRRFREETRGRRVEIAREAQHKFRRKV